MTLLHCPGVVCRNSWACGYHGLSARPACQYHTSPKAAGSITSDRITKPAMPIRQPYPSFSSCPIGADNTPASNRTTNAGATLGRVLFYDRRLSVNDRVSCSSCHQQQFAFSDTAKLSRGFAGGFTGRHSMGLANARFYANARFFWDERAASLEAQVLQPIQDATEMGMTLPNVLTKLSATTYYPALFAAAFYLVLSGAEVATQRAFIMTAIVLFGVMFDRPALTLRTLAVAALGTVYTALIFEVEKYGLGVI